MLDSPMVLWENRELIMTPEEVQVYTTMTLIRLEAMKAKNQDSAYGKYPPWYNENHFMELMEKYKDSVHEFMVV